MGYDRRAALNKFRLTFDEPEFSGMVFRAYAPGFEALLASARVERAEARKLSPAVWLAEFSGLVDELFLAMIDWELEEDGRPVPLTREALRRQDLPFLRALVRAWGQTVNASQVAPVEEVPSVEAALGIPMTPFLPEAGSPPAELRTSRKPRAPRARPTKTA